MTDLRLPSMSPTESLVMDLLRGRECFITSRQEERAPTTSGLPRRLYHATPYGVKVHDAFSLLREALALKPAEAQ
jgi:hypothetical protein